MGLVVAIGLGILSAGLPDTAVATQAGSPAPVAGKARGAGVATGPFVPSLPLVAFAPPVTPTIPGVDLSSRRSWSCVPFARSVSAVQLQGDGWQWWQAAEREQYHRGQRPQAGAVLVFRKTRDLRRGHVAVVRQVLDSRTILVDHANWGGRGHKGRVDLGVMVRDVSPGNDWSQTRVWYTPIRGLGSTTYPTYGFVYAPGTGPDRAPRSTPGLRLASVPAAESAGVPHQAAPRRQPTDEIIALLPGRASPPRPMAKPAAPSAPVASQIAAVVTPGALPAPVGAIPATLPVPGPKPALAPPVVVASLDLAASGTVPASGAAIPPLPPAKPVRN